MAGLILGFILFHCDLPQPPPGPKSAEVSLILNSSNGDQNNYIVIDTVGNITNIGMILYLTQYIDSISILVTSGSSIEYNDTYMPKEDQADTISYPVTFETDGDRAIKVTGYIEGQPDLVATGTLRIVSRPVVNQGPELSIKGSTQYEAGDTVVLLVSATDPDSDQTVTIKAVGKPEHAAFSSDTLKWVTTLADTGTDTIIFIASDSYTPSMSDTGIAVITVTNISSNHSPVWTSDSIEIEGLPDSPISLQLKDRCSDPEEDSILFSLSSGKPAGDTVSGSVYSFTPSEKDTGTHTVRIVAKDTKGASSKLVIRLTITKSDLKNPVITLSSSLSDTVIAADSLNIKATCKDESGIRSCIAYLDTVPFTMIKLSGTDDLWAGTIKPLTAGKHTVKLIATDSSNAANKDTAVISVRYDNDTIKPVITRAVPAQDSATTNSSSYTITIDCTDESGILSVKGTFGTKTFEGSRGSGDSWTISATDLAVNVFNPVTVTATDSSLRSNKTTMAFYIKYDPTMLDTIAPTISRKSGPVSGAVVNGPFIEIRDSIYDPSGIDSVYWTINGVWAGTLKPLTGSPGMFLLKDTLTTFHNNRIVIHAIDDASRKNHDSLVVLLDYNAFPSIRDTAVATKKNSETAFTLIARSPDSDPIAWSLITDPAHGTLSGTLPSLTFTPANNYQGADSFFVKITDNTWSDTAKVRITIADVNFPPVVKDSAVTTNEDTPVTFSLSGSDPDGTPLSGWTITKQGSHGTAAIAVSPANRITYSPADDFSGKDTFNFMAGDGSLFDTGSIIVTVTAVNDPPVVSKNRALTVPEGGVGRFNTSRLDFTDPDNSSDDFEITFTALTKTGTLKLDGVNLLLSSNLTYDELTSPGLTYTHNGSETEADSFSFRISDGQESTTGTFRFAISMVNDQPTVSKTGSQMKSTCGIGNVYYDTLTITDPEEAYSSIKVSMVPSDAKAVINSSGRVVISWLADFNRYGYNQAVRCTLKVIDAADTLSIGWETTVGQHVWTPIFASGSGGTYYDNGARIAARDSFTLFTGYVDYPESSPHASLYRCVLGNVPSWTEMPSISISTGLGEFICNNSRLVTGDYSHATVYSFNTTTGLKADTIPGYNMWGGAFLADDRSDIFTYKENAVYKNGTVAYQLDDNLSEKRIQSAVSTSSMAFLLINRNLSGGIARVTQPISSTSSYYEVYSTSLLSGGGKLFTDNNNADTLYADLSSRNDGVQIRRIVNFPSTTTPAITTVALPEASSEGSIMNILSGSVGWYKTGDKLYFSRNGFANSNVENFHAGFVPSAVIISGDKKAVFAVGTDGSIYRY